MRRKKTKAEKLPLHEELQAAIEAAKGTWQVVNDAVPCLVFCARHGRCARPGRLCSELVFVAINLPHEADLFRRYKELCTAPALAAA